MTWLDAAVAAFVATSVALVLIDEVDGARGRWLHRALSVAWVPLAVAFVAKATAVLAPIVRGLTP
jgi:hypothetical protein